MDSTVYSAYGSIRYIIDIVENQQIDFRCEDELIQYNAFLVALQNTEHALYNIGVKNGTIV
mgnify:FL=1